ncbi:MAG: PDZ domain-containing protein, partial [Thermoanaerobaculia bacterium]
LIVDEFGIWPCDRVAATGLETRLKERLGALAEWALSERTERGFELLRGEGIDRELLRALASGGGATEAPDWAALQQALDAGLGGSAYLLAVLSDDLYASRADLWLWAAQPGPTHPARRRISLGDATGVEELAAALDRPLRLSSPWVGARFVDSAAAGAPLVLSVEADGPAAAAGLRPGDTVRVVDGRPVAGARVLTELVAGLEAGREVILEVGDEGAGRGVSLIPGASPVVASLSDPSALDPALAARLASLEMSGAAGAPAWLVRLNRGVVLMRSGEWRRAAEALRGIEAPAGGGVGKATIDYLLGVALLEVDRAAYRDTALGLIGRAAEGRARLEHNDGPLVAPRALARLETLLRE